MLQLEKEDDDKDLERKEQERVDHMVMEMEQELLAWEKEHVKRKSRKLKEGNHRSFSNIRTREQEEGEERQFKKRKLKYCAMGEEWGDTGVAENSQRKEESQLLPREALMRRK